jgi:hypothetical protein
MATSRALRSYEFIMIATDIISSCIHIKKIQKKLLAFKKG